MFFFRPQHINCEYYLCFMIYKACILLGSNLEDRYGLLQTAEQYIQAGIGKIVRTSSIYTTKAWGLKEQPDFLNKVIQLETTLAPLEVLERLLSIENEMGRTRTEKWGPRLIDLDLLFYDTLVYKDAELTIPHPGIPYRKFTLVPMLEILPEFIHPVFGKTIRELAEKCEDESEVTRIILPVDE